MDADTGIPLCSYSQFTAGAFSDLVSGFSQDAVQDILIEATRKCESITGRRLAPFTITETQRAAGIDPDEYAATSNIATSIQGTLGMSEASSLSVTNLIRHHWLREFPPRYQELWSYSNVAVTVYRSYGGSQGIFPGQIILGPDDLGHLWFQLGQFIPAASHMQVVYSGGYTIATPADLLRACKFIAAAIAIDELNPEDSTHNPDRLMALGEKWLAGYMRDGSLVAK